jgi:hypothetical protein
MPAVGAVRTGIAATEQDQSMRMYIFKSETRPGLCAFAADQAGSRLPDQHGPWTVTGVVGPTSAMPHNISREAIEQAIDAHGFQMWRLAQPADARA